MLNGLCGRCLAAASLDEDASEYPIAGEYELLGELGRGGMGVVYIARQRGLDRLVAVKMLLAGGYAGPAAEERLLLEARSAARLKHPNIVAIHQVGRHEGKPFYSMELIEGEDLATRIARGGLSPRDIALIVAKAARAVQHAHEQGVLHRDLKPANLLIDNRTGEPLITDFGLVVAIDGFGGLTRTGEVLGSPGFMAPEQLQGKASVSTDVYGLGAILYYGLTKRAPYVAAQLAELLEAVRRADLVAPRRLDPSIPLDLDTIAMRALAPEPSSRYASAAELADDLERWLDRRPIRARPLNRVQLLWRWAKRNQALSTAIAALAVAIFLGGVGVTYQWRRAERVAADARALLYSADLKVASDALLAADLGLAQRTLEHCPVQQRDTAWGLLWPRTRGDVDAILGAARWTVTSIAVSPDGKLAASAEQDDVARLWDVEAKRLVYEFPESENGWWTAFSPDGSSLFIGTDNKVTQWDVARRAKLRDFPGQTGQLSPDGKTLYTCSGRRFVFEGQLGAVSAWDVSDGSLQRHFPGSARLIALSHDGSRLAVSDAYTYIAVYDARDGHAVIPPWSTGGQLWRMEFSPDDALLVTSGWSKNVRVWNLQNISAAPHPLEHGSNIWETAFSPDGKLLAVACSDRQVYLWNTATWRVARKLAGHHDEVWSVGWEPNGKLLTAGRDPRLLQWDVTRTPAASHVRHDVNTFDTVWMNHGRIATMRVRKEGLGTEVASTVDATETFFVGETPIGFDPKTNRLWLWHESGELRARHDEDLTRYETVKWQAFPGEERFEHPHLNFRAGLAWITLKNGVLAIHRLSDGQRIARYDDIHVEDPWASEMSPDGRRFVWAGPLEKSYLTNLETRAHKQLIGHGYAIACTVFSSNGSWFVTGGIDGKLLVWDTETGALLRQLGQHETSVGRMALSADDRTLISHEIERGVRLWHTDTVRDVGMIESLDEVLEHWLGLSPDGRWLGLRRSDGVIQVFPVAHPTDGPTP